MVLLCKCGNFKTASPYRSSVTKQWMCDKCRARATRTHQKLQTASPAIVVEQGTLLQRMRRKAS